MCSCLTLERHDTFEVARGISLKKVTRCLHRHCREELEFHFQIDIEKRKESYPLTLFLKDPCL